LASPKYNGRLSGSPGYIAAAEWVAGNLRKWGIKPGGDNGDYFQWFDKGYNEVHELGSLCLHIPVKDGKVIKKYYPFPDQFFPGMTSASGELTAEVVYIGYGVTAPEHNYDDYKGIDVKGKIVLMNRDVPFKNSRDPEYTKWVKYCYHQYKLENAVKHRTAGMLYIGGNHANPNISHDPNFIWCGIGPEPLEDIFAGFKISNKDVLKKIDESRKPHSFNTGTRFYIGAGKSYPGIYKYLEDANQQFLHRSMRASETRDNYGRPRTDGAIFSRAGIPTLGIGITGSLKPVHYHRPGDTAEMVTPEVMEDVSKLLYIALTRMALEENINLEDAVYDKYTLFPPGFDPESHDAVKK